MANEELLTVQDAMRVLRLSRLSIYRAIASGRLTALKVGGGKLWRIRPKVLEDYIRGGSRSATHSKR
ncbi:MAG: helix-turn-helix domain-containing protein [Candidatus Aminicenantes bacterium]|jgi:excisionase family DNA binding protein|nr:helix-turn-helix domain-containing protein [Candidatus Aminicenantes bacterium]